MTQRARKLKTLSTKEQHRDVPISLAKLQLGPVYRCKGDSFLPVCCSSRFAGAFSSPLCYSPSTPNWPPIQRAPDLKSQAWFPWPWEKLSSCSSTGCIWTVPPPHHPLAVPNKHTVTSKDVSELWSHPGHFHPLNLLWRNTPNTELMDSCLSLNTSVLLPLWNVFLYSAVYLHLILCIVNGSPSQKSYYKITYKIYLIFTLLLYIPCGDK